MQPFTGDSSSSPVGVQGPTSSIYYRSQKFGQRTDADRLNLRSHVPMVTTIQALNGQLSFIGITRCPPRPDKPDRKSSHLLRTAPSPRSEERRVGKESR